MKESEGPPDPHLLAEEQCTHKYAAVVWSENMHKSTIAYVSNNTPVQFVCAVRARQPSQSPSERD